MGTNFEFKIDNKVYPTYYIEFADVENTNDFLREFDNFITNLLASRGFWTRINGLNDETLAPGKDPIKAGFSSLMELLLADNGWSIALSCIPYEEVDTVQYVDQANQLMRKIAEKYTLHKRSGNYTSEPISELIIYYY